MKITDTTLFDVPKLNHFLWYKKNMDSNHISMHADMPTFPELVAPTFDSLFPEETPINYLRGKNDVVYIVNVLRNRVAQNTRRAAANTLYCRPEMYKHWLKKHTAMKVQTLPFEHVEFVDIPENEIRVGLWRPSTPLFDAHEGGLQVFNGQTYMNHNHTNYFAKAVL